MTGKKKDKDDVVEEVAEDFPTWRGLRLYTAPNGHSFVDKDMYDAYMAEYNRPKPVNRLQALTATPSDEGDNAHGTSGDDPSKESGDPDSGHGADGTGGGHDQ